MQTNKIGDSTSSRGHYRKGMEKFLPLAEASYNYQKSAQIALMEIFFLSSLPFRGFFQVARKDGFHFVQSSL